LKTEKLALTFFSVLKMPITDILECSKEAERAGLEYLSVAESFYLDAGVLATAIASHTSKVKLGSSVLPIYTRSPFSIAMSIATLHEASGGRVGFLGLGVGYRSRTEGYFGARIE
jgi:alkanesulfonate monooxygenase SsuD/methylene tetrahydromethanopterin reductase-like flavin-dependent oxidoreductase (luciferase family)